MRGFWVVALLAGCATAPNATVMELTPWSPPRGQPCSAQPIDFPLEAVVDSAAADSALRSAAPGDGAILVSVRVDSAGEVSRFHRIETTFAEVDAGRVEAGLRGALRGTEGKGRAGRLHAAVTGGAVTALEIGATETCRPVIADQQPVRSALLEVYQFLRREGTVNVWLFVDTTGAVTKGHVNRGTGDMAFDAAVLEAGKRGRFHPALVDRRPIGVYVALDLIVELQELCAEGETQVFPRETPNPCRRIR